jgi:uncharacterized protein (DUF1778 family)
MRKTRNREETPKPVVLNLRVTEDFDARVRLAAQAETRGNVSEFMRRALEDRIATMLRRAA